MKKEMNKEKLQVFEGIVAICGNTVLFVAKMWAGIVTGSVALMADAWHTLSDSLSSLFIIIAAKLAAKKPDKEHPFGHGRWESIATILIACLLVFVGYDFVVSSIEKLQNRESVEYGTIAIVVTVASILAKEAMAQYAFYIGRKTNNPVVTADGWHHRTDTLSSIVVLAGIVAARLVDGLWWMDGILGMLCALFLFYAALKIMKEAITEILGEEPTQELIDEINSEITALYGNSLKTHHFHLHCYVLQKELTMHIMLDRNMSIEEGHKIASTIEKMIKEKFEMTATIHTEPLEN